jgi:hypothetical protein
MQRVSLIAPSFLHIRVQALCQPSHITLFFADVAAQKKSVHMIHGYTYHTDQIVSVTKPHYKILNLSIQLECKHEKNTWGKLKAVLLSQITAKESLI